jgi:hypothetical protein
MSHVTNLVHLNEFPMSRCVMVLQEVGRRALARDASAIAAQAGRAAAEAQRAVDRDTRQQAADLGHLVEHGVNGIASYCNAQVRVFRGEERAAAAERVKGALLPEGTGSITSLPAEAQRQQVDVLLARAQAPALAADMALLIELPVLLGRLRVVNEKLGAALRTRDSGPTAEEMRAERERCQALLGETVGLILAHYAGQPEQRADRDYLLEPFVGHHVPRNDQQPAQPIVSAA